jgi:hypothetical protein
MSEELMTKVQELIDNSINPAVAATAASFSWLT